VAYYFSYEKARLARQRVREASKGVGKPRIGGPFALIDQDGKRFTSEDIKGKFTLVSIIDFALRDEKIETEHDVR